jgi:uncharacterized repeat protein (TIGR03847 family)
MTSFSFERCDRFLIGTVGMPGEREFYLQITQDDRHTSFAMEKGQASALSERMRQLLKELRRRNVTSAGLMSKENVDDDPLTMPVDSEFPLGDMSLIWVEESEMIVFEASSADQNVPGTLAVSLSVSQANEFIRRTDKVVSAGRAPCPFCGLPLNVDGHLCPRANGYRR